VKRSLLALLVWVSPLQRLPARPYQEVPELAKCFQDKGVVGTFVLFDIATDTMFVSDEARALNHDMLKDEDAAKRIPIGRECLKALGKL
jgi:beta-lactamase class D